MMPIQVVEDRVINWEEIRYSDYLPYKKWKAD